MSNLTKHTNRGGLTALLRSTVHDDAVAVQLLCDWCVSGNLGRLQTTGNGAEATVHGVLYPSPSTDRRLFALRLLKHLYPLSKGSSPGSKGTATDSTMCQAGGNGDSQPILQGQLHAWLDYRARNGGGSRYKTVGAAKEEQEIKDLLALVVALVDCGLFCAKEYLRRLVADGSLDPREAAPEGTCGHAFGHTAQSTLRSSVVKCHRCLSLCWLTIEPLDFCNQS